MKTLKISIQVIAATLMLSFIPAQEQNKEPAELLLLREQFSNRIEQEMKPWRARYAQELQKLEDRLIKERKLSEALAVKKEKENYQNTDLSKKPAKPSVPDTAEKAKEAMTGSVWLVYKADDKKREFLWDTYHFVDAKSVYVLSTKQSFTWSAKSHEEIVIKFLAGDIVMDVYFDDGLADSKYQDRNYQLVLVGNLKKQ